MYPREARWSDLSMGQKLVFWGVLLAVAILAALVVAGVLNAPWWVWVGAGALLLLGAGYMWAALALTKAGQQDGDRP